MRAPINSPGLKEEEAKMLLKRDVMRIALGSCILFVAPLVGEHQASAERQKPTAAAPKKPAAPIYVVYGDATLGAGTNVSAAFNSKILRLVSIRYLAMPEWEPGVASDYTECHPVPCGQPAQACPKPVSEVGMDCAKTQTMADGTTVVSVNTQPAVANRHYRTRIELTLQ
jgi:hypothetical protein